MATPSQWEQHFTCKWFNPGRLDMSGFPEDMPTCLQFYLTSIRSEEWTEGMEMIQDGEGHCFANETGIVFPVDYVSTSSEEGEQSKGPLQEDEVAFFAGFFSKDRVKKSVFLSTIRKCLEERRRQYECGPFDGEEQFLMYVSKEICSGSGSSGLEAKYETKRQTEGKAWSPQKEGSQLQQKKTRYLLLDKAGASNNGKKEAVDALTMPEEERERHKSVAAPILPMKRERLPLPGMTPGTRGSKRMKAAQAAAVPRKGKRRRLYLP